MARGDPVSNPTDEQVMAALLVTRQSKLEAPNAAGETWIKARCDEVFHDHDDGSAPGLSILVSSHVVHCFHGYEYAWGDLTEALHIHAQRGGYSPQSRAAGQRKVAELTAAITRQKGALDAEEPEELASPPARATPVALEGNTGEEHDSTAPPIPLPRIVRHDYFDPDSGEPSFYTERRLDAATGKTLGPVIPHHLDGREGIPDGAHPLYGDLFLKEGSIVLVVEGEKCVDAVASVKDSHNDIPIQAVSWQGGSNKARHHADLLALTLDGLSPKAILTWPDNDAPGFKAIKEVEMALKRHNLPFLRVRPKDHDLQQKQDVADYLDRGESLASLVERYSAASSERRVSDFTDGLIFPSSTTMAWPETREVVDLSNRSVEMLWHKRGLGPLPRLPEMRELMATCNLRAFESRLRLTFRRHSTGDGFYWLGSATERPWHVSADGTVLADDPQGVFIGLNQAQPRHTSVIDPSADSSAWDEVCATYRLSKLDGLMALSWMICALCDLETPIILLKGRAETGKSHLARFLLSVVDPTCPEISLSNNNPDERELLLTLKTNPALLLDNLSGLSGHFEDLLSRIVTGYNRSLRPLNQNFVEYLQLRRALLITTISYDIYKSDLSSRIVICTPEVQYVGRDSDESVQWLDSLMPRVRGYLFNCCATYYRNRDSVQLEAHGFRIASVSRVLASLGHDPVALFAEERTVRAEIVNRDDPLQEAIVDYWEAQQPSQFCERSTGEFVDWLRDHLKARGFPDRDLPTASKRFARYIREKAENFRDFGFTVEKRDTTAFRGYRFRSTNPTVELPLSLMEDHNGDDDDGED